MYYPSQKVYSRVCLIQADHLLVKTEIIRGGEEGLINFLPTKKEGPFLRFTKRQLHAVR